MTQDESVTLAEGMPVSNEDGEALGKLAGLLIEEGEEEAEFLLLETSGGEHLIPFEAVLGVGDGALVLALPVDSIASFPRLGRDASPTGDEMDLAYDVLESVGTHEAHDHEEEDA